MDDRSGRARAQASRDGGVPTSSGEASLRAKLLPFVLGATAGSADVIGFLGLGGLFIAHITGNLVILAARIGGGDRAPLAHLLSVPVFITVLALARLLAAALERIRIAPLVPLLALQLALLSAFLAVCIIAGTQVDPNSASMIIAGMLGVSAMAVQNTLVVFALNGAPSTAVMTTNITRLVMDLGEVLLGRGAGDRAKAGERARHTGLAIAGFLLGCTLGAACQATLGLRSVAVPAGLALLALVLGIRGAQARASDLRSAASTSMSNDQPVVLTDGPQSRRADAVSLE
ncbi:DUF1275 domain-containing protein [Yersinia enterocolitica]|nr:DUF1275 domain-containing protein [Yersinia enterocolitica]EKN3797944.1 DUF1275 domain-containing protein [Yersinia enterocolitica]EKN4176557.1 DUF1275 domain-containing protein [Yersinia enterocolitica]ELY5229951.1 DUF1275 domain-containing protein [Yersinia enterocolitica]